MLDGKSRFRVGCRQPLQLTAKLLGLLLANFRLDRVLDQLASAAQGQLVFDMGLIGFHSLDAEVEALGDLAGATSLADQAEDLELPVGESREARVQVSGCAADVLVEQLIRHLLAEVDISAKNPPKRDQDFLGGLLLHDVAVGAGAKG